MLRFSILFSLFLSFLPSFLDMSIALKSYFMLSISCFATSLYSTWPYLLIEPYGTFLKGTVVNFHCVIAEGNVRSVQRQWSKIPEASVAIGHNLQSILHVLIKKISPKKKIWALPYLSIMVSLLIWVILCRRVL